MIVLPDPAGFPERPPSEVEWEDLLVRVEIAPRALRIAVEEAPDDPAVMEALRSGVRWAGRLREALEAMREGRVATPREEEGRDEADALLLLEELTRLRARSFALAQRRGLDVWKWRARGGPLDGATAYQLFLATVEVDREVLTRVRGVRAGGPAC